MYVGKNPSAGEAVLAWGWRCSDQNPLLAPSTAGAMESAEAAQPTEKSAGADLYVLKRI